MKSGISKMIASLRIFAKKPGFVFVLIALVVLGGLSFRFLVKRELRIEKTVKVLFSSELSPIAYDKLAKDPIIIQKTDSEIKTSVATFQQKLLATTAGNNVIPITVISDKGEIDFFPVGGLNADAQTEGNKIKYIDAFSGADLEYELFQTMVKETIIVKSLNSQRDFSFQFPLPSNAQLNKDKQGGIIVKFGGQDSFYLHPIVAKDSVDKNIVYKYDLEKGVEGYLIKVSGENQEQFDDAVFPIIIDPTISWEFSASYSYTLSDPSKIEVADGVLRLVDNAGSYSTDNPYGINNTTVSYDELSGFTETPTTNNQGTIQYQLSKDGTNWFWWNGSNWVGTVGGFSESNLATIINTNISSFHTQVGTGALYFKAFLHATSNSTPVEIGAVNLTYILTDITAPTITSISPDLGSTAGGAQVTITGINFITKAPATGGIISTAGGYTFHTFISNGTFTAPSDLNVEVLVVGGGGGGGGGEYNPAGDGPGGGGAGGYRDVSNFAVTAQSYNVTVGNGGAGASGSSINGVKGGDSIFSTIVATGGGYGSREEGPGGAGGSGGGAGGPCGTGDRAAGLGNTPSTIPSQGNNGGMATDGGCSYRSGAGGGGAGGVGQNNLSNGGGASGGTGVTSSIFGKTMTIAGGGGGGTGRNAGNLGGSGQAGGGNGGSSPNGPGANAIAGTGSGGGGAGSGTNIGGAGGSGLVIIKYLTPVTTVLFGETPAINVVVVNSTTITATLPSHTAGAVDIVVNNLEAQPTTLIKGFTYFQPTISAVNSDSGPTAGGTNITITGTNFVEGGLATGGTITTSGAYTIHTFNSSDTFNVPTDRNVEVLVIGGGGGGGSGESNPAGDGAGGGGAGGYLYSPSYSLPAGSHSITVGLGGAGAPGSQVNGSKGRDSVFKNFIAIGGGYGAGQESSGGFGGSGGGAGGPCSYGNIGGGRGWQGNNGGMSYDYFCAWRGGSGGGGSGGVGGNNISNGGGGTGGSGTSNSITGTSVARAGGGGGGAGRNVGNLGGSGQAGGGNGGSSPSGAGGNATANTGSGGGAAGSGTNTGGSGGSGVVIIKYLTPVTSVTFGGTTATNVEVVDATTITATVPSHVAGAVDVVVTNLDSQSTTLTNGFTFINPPIVTSILPVSASKEGGDVVIISGSDYFGTPSVTFDGVEGTSVNRIDSNTLSVVTPAHVPGAVDVVVTNPDGGIDSLIGGFTYIENPPIISSITPNIGLTSGGTPITITGINFLADGNGTGGTITTSGGYTIHTFTSSGTFTIMTPGVVEILVVAGGGGGGLSRSAGGGGGGVIYEPSFSITNQTYSVTVGNGGIAGNSGTEVGGNGSNSIFSTLTAIGGGGGAGYTLSLNGNNGGSGGGGAGWQVGIKNGGIATIGQGNNGGTGVGNGVGGWTAGGGGGGAGAVGANATGTGAANTNNLPGAGGIGIANSISGSSIYYAGGGGGHGINSAGAESYASGGSGGGGSGGSSGIVNTGGGGSTNGAGGSGIVVVRYLTPKLTVALGGTLATNVVVVDSTTITATIPAHSAGAVDVVVTNPDAQITTLTNGYTYRSPPTVTSVTPASVSKDGGNSVIISGSDFVGTPTVTFGGTEGTSVNRIDANTINVITPAHAGGLVDVVVTNPDGGTSTLIDGLTYSEYPPIISSITPNIGASSGGTVVTINGSNFTPGDFGTGADGSVTLSVNKNINTDVISGSRTCADAKNYSVISLTKFTATLSSNPASNCLSVDDEVLLISLQGTSTNYSNVGNYETLIIAGIDNSLITFKSPKLHYYGNLENSDSNIGIDASKQRVMLQRVPNYVNMTINSNITLTADPWDGTKGGVLFFRVNGTLTNNGIISVNNNGYRYGNAVGGGQAQQGESYTGLGTNASSANGGAGGGGYTAGCAASQGGPASFATNGTNGYGSTGGGGGSYTAGIKGSIYANSSKLMLGSGGGGGSHNCHASYGRGGSGGGAILIYSSTLSNSGVISSKGENGGSGNGDSAGGSGSGGSIYLFNKVGNLGSNLVNANGGTVVQAGSGEVLAYYADSISGTTATSSTITQYSPKLINVDFGNTPATSIVFIDSNTITATTPLHTVGVVDVDVHNSDGTTVKLSNGFTYSYPPTITSVTPSSVSKDGGNSVVISGTSFFGTPTVTFGGTPGTSVNRTDANTISVVTPAHAVGFVDVVVTNPDDKAGTLVNGLKYTENPPTISSISPNTGSTAGMTDVTISGTDFILGSPAVGGTITTSGGYTIHTFTSSGTFYTPTDRNVEVLVVGGGGGSSGFGSGGGGAGGVIYNSSYSATSGSINVTVGNGGAGASGSGLGSNGANSVFGSLIAIGGGTSGYDAVANGASGGSGGGAGTWAGDSGSGGSGIAGQGYVGGNQSGQHEKGAGGGGAGGPGWGGTSFSRGGDGGAGVANLISGTSIIYGGGGGGGVRVSSSVSGGNGGLGGGGRGDNNNSLNGTAGTANTGGGGGGSQGYSNTTAPGHAGGSGIVVVRYLTPNTNITFGGIPAVNVTVVNPTTITATTPVHSAGAVDVVDTNTDGLSTTLTNGFTYSSLTISSISPDSGAPTGGTDITITGTNFVAGDSTFGGTITTSGDYTIHTFTSSGIFTVPIDRNVEVLVVGGGGGSSGFGGGGGGAGGVIYNSYYAVTQGIINVTIGSGGVGAVASGLGSNGANSIFGSLTAIGGGTSAFDQIANGVTGGSGGGAGAWYGNNGSGGSGTTNQGYAGGNQGSQYEKASGGGGAGGIGISGSTNSRGGDGGPGVANSISGTSVLYGGGGGGGVRVSSSVSGGNGGSGGGGRGDDYNSLNGTSGTANTGGGGGGSQGYSNTSAPGHSGGSGIVIVRYLTPKLTVALGGTLASNVVVVDSTTITAITPTHIPGYVDVVVTNSDGTIETLTNGFTYNIPPTVTSVTPSSVSKDGGNSVIISGTGFVGTPTVTFDGTPGTFVNRTDGNTISVVTPAHAVGAVDVVVTNPDGGIGILVNGLTYTEPSIISNVSPNEGPNSGGTEVTITGTKFSPRSPASGGIITTSGPYTIHTFTTNGTFSVPNARNVEVLVLGGGGGGGRDWSGGGGGAGGYQYNANYSVIANDYSVVVGDGGASATTGNNSVFDTLTANGGGAGGSYSSNGGNGGSGGGGSGGSGSRSGGIGNQGYNGGIGYLFGDGRTVGGGGGGTGTIGSNYNQPGNGGLGTANSISGSSIIYGGGGGGGSETSDPAGTGGVGGGGNGSKVGVGSNGTANRGGGGGGAGGSLSSGGIGGSGIVIIRYLTASADSVTFGGTPATNIVFVNSTTITATTPSHTVGVVDVDVHNSDGTTATLSNGFTYNPTPTVTSVNPSSVSKEGGITITISGSDFIDTPTVNFGGVAGTSVNRIDANTISVVAPIHAVGLVDVVVVNPDGGLGTLTNGLTYTEIPPTISLVSPNTEPIVGGTNVTITGANFWGDYGENTKLLLHNDGTGSSFVDSSVSSKTINVGVNATQSNTQAKFGTKSGYFDGSSYITTPTSADFNLGTANFTIDTWVYPTSVNGKIAQFGNSANNQAYTLVISNGILSFTAWGLNVGAPIVTSGSTSVPVNQWTHVAISRSGSYFYLFINGNLVGTSSAYSGAISTGGANNVIGTGYDSNVGGYGYAGYFNGFIDEFRVTKGTARWTSNFSVSTRAYAQPNVTFGGVSATNIIVVDSTTITATTPAHISGAVDVVVTNIDGLAGTLSNGFTYVQELATKLKIISNPYSINAGNYTGAIQVEAQKNDNTPATLDADTIVTLALDPNSGTFKLEPNTGAIAVTQVTILESASSAIFYYTNTTKGLYTISVSSVDLTSDTQDVTVDSASPSKLVFLSAPQTRQAGQESLQMRVQLQDAYNNSVNAQSNIPIDLATSTLTGKFSITNGVNWLDTDMATIGTGSNDIFFYYKDTAMVNATLTVDETPDIGIQLATQTYSIFAGSFARLGFSTVSQTLIAGQPSNAMIVTTYDIYGNVTTLDQETTFYLYSKKTSGNFSSTNQFSSTITEIVIPADASSHIFYYKDIVSGDAELIVSDQSMLDDPTDVGIVNAKQTQTINWGDPNKISLTNPNGAWTAGQGKALEINLQNQYDIIVPTDLSQIIYLYSSSQSGKYSLTNSFDPGDVIVNILIPAHADGISVYYMETSAIAETLTVSDNPTNPEVPDEGLTNSTLAVSILSADLVSFRFITSGQSLSAGQISGPVTIQSSDIYGNAKSVTGDVTVYFYSDSPTMEFSTVSDFASTSTSAILNSGTTTLSFYVKDVTVGTHSIITSDYAILDDPDAGIVNAQQNILISEGTISQLVFSANLGQVIAGGISSPITVISKNQYGVNTPVLNNTTLYLFSSSLQGRFATSVGGPWDINTITILQGQSSVEFYYRDGLFGDPTITVSDTASASPDITWTNAISTISVIPGEISQLAILTEPQSVIARHPSSNIRVQTQNMYGNPTAVSEITPIYLNSTSNQSEFFDPDLGIWGVSHKDMQIGQNTINFNYHDNLVGTSTLTFADSLPLVPDSGWTNASQQETIIIQTINHISLTNISDPQEQGSSSSVIAQAQDSDGYVVDWYDGTVHFSSSDSDATLPLDYTFNPTIDMGTHTFANSVAFLHTGEKTVNIVDEHGIAGSQVGITVTANSAGPISKVTIESAVSPLIINKNNSSGIITIKTLDTDNKPSNAPTGGFPVRVTSDKATGEFSISSNGPWTSVGLFTIPQDLSTINFYYKDGAIGTPTLTVSDWVDSVDDPLILNDSLEALIKSLSISVDTSLLVNNNSHVDVLSQIIYAKDDTGYYYAKPSFNMSVTDETTGLSTNANLSVTFKNPQGTIIETQQTDNVNNYIYTPTPISGTATEGNYTLEIQAINLINGLTGTQTIQIPVSGWTIMVNYDPTNNYVGHPLTISASIKHNGVPQDPDNFSINLRDNNGYNLIDPQYTKQKNDMTRDSVGSYSGSMDTIGLTPNVAYFLSSRIYDLNNILAEDSNYDIYLQPYNACDLITKAKIMNGLGADATEVDTLTMNVDNPVDFYVAGYDINNNFCNNTTLGTWTVTGFNGDAFAQINIPNALTISFNPHKAPATGTLVFTSATITGDTTGILTEETGNATSFEVTATTSIATAGVPFTTLDIVAKDQYGNVAVNSYNGTKTLTVTGLGVGPENDSPTAIVTATFNNGLATILDTGITFVKAETVKVTITDNDAIYSPKPTGQSGNIIVSSGEPTHFHIVSPSTVTAGTSFDITSITAHDQYGNIATGYSGIKTITYTGPSIGLNNDNPTYTTSVNFTNGAFTTTLSTVLYKNETVKIHIADGSISGDSDDVTVQIGSPALISMISGDAQTGRVNIILSNSLIVKVEDSSGNFIENQTVQFSVTAGNGSVGSASPVTDVNGLAQTTWRLGTIAGGVNTVQAVLNGVAGSPVVFTATATPAALSIFEVVAPPSAIAGTPFSVTVNAQDSLNNIDVNYFGTKIINFSGPAENGPTSGISAYPATIDFVNGSVTFQVTLVKAETVKITLTDNNSIYDPKPTGQSGDIVVASGAPTHLHIISPTPVAIGTSFNLTSIVAHDLYGNIATGYSGNKTITYSGPGDKDSVHPTYTTSVNFTSGMSTTILTTILVKVELITITVTDGTINGESEQIQVTSTQDFYLELVSGNNQTGTVGTMLAQDLVVAVYNRNGILTEGKTVQFNPTSGSSTGSLTSDNVGLVTIRWTLGTSSGTQTATFSMVGISSTINFTASANVGPPFKVAFITGSKNIRVNAVSSQITVCLQDQYGNTSQPVSNNVLVTLDGTSTTKSFATSATGPWGVTSANIVIGTYCTNIYYKNSEPGNYELQVSADPDYQGDSQAISIMPNELILLSVTPDSFNLKSNKTQQMTAKVYNQDNVEEPNVTILWSMADGRAGSISQSGLFTSSNTPGVYLNAIKASYGSLEAFADVTVSSTTSTITPSVTRGPSTLTPAVTITPTLTTTPTPTPTPSNLSNYMTILLNNYGNPIFITRSPYPVILSPKQGSLINGDNITISGTSDADSLIVLTSTSGQVLGTGHSDYQGNWKIVLGADAVNTDKIQVVATIHGTSKSSLPVTFSIQQQDLWEQIRQFINAILNI